MAMSDNGNGSREPVPLETSRGKHILLQSVSPHFLGDLGKVTNMPEAPYREIPTDLPGHVEKEPLTANDLRDDDERKRWTEYQNQRRQALNTESEKFLQAIYYRGVIIEDQDLDDWAEEQEFWGIQIPENRIARKIQYIKHEVVGSTDDILNIVTGVLEQTGIPKEEMQRVESMFRSSIRRRTSAATDDAVEQLELERDLPADEGSTLLGDLASE